MSKVFLKRGDFYNVTDGNFSVIDSLDEGVYQIHQVPMTGELFLEKIAQNFHFGFKLYGIDDKLVNHVVNTYNKQENKHNLGILLNGAKGTGKTVTAKYLCNKLGLPVIICDYPYGGLPSFLAGINHDCVFLFDEFEKNFRIECGDDPNCAGEDLLSIMDGVYNSDNCHVFILTTNELRVNDNLLSRPSRIRYLKSFGDVISRKVLEEYVDDNLNNKEYRDEILDFIDTLTIATIDIVKSVVDEVNLHDVHVSEFKDIFNVKEASYFYYTRSWIYDEGSGDPTFNKDEFLKRCKAYKYSYHADELPDENYDWRPDWSSLRLNKSIKKLKKGDVVSSQWKLEEIDLSNSFLKLRHTSYRSRCQFVLVENINETPSLYERVDSASVDDDGPGNNWWE